MKSELEQLLKAHMADFSQTTTINQTGKAIFAFAAMNSEKVWVGTTINAQALLGKVLARQRGVFNNVQFPAAFIRHVQGREEIRFFACRRYTPERVKEIKDLLRENGYLVNPGA